MIVTGFPPAAPAHASPRLSRRALAGAAEPGPRFHVERGDGFETARRPLVNLGGSALAAPSSDAGYVTELYRELLGRAPDPEGFASHLAGLAAGLPRERLRQIFLESPEYQALLRAAEPPPPAPPPPAERPSPIAGEADFGAAYPKIKKLKVAQSARACPNAHATLWTQAFVRGRSNNGWKVPDAKVRELVERSGGDLEQYTKEMLYAVAERMRRPLAPEEARVVIFKVQRQYAGEVEALMRRYGF